MAIRHRHSHIVFVVSVLTATGLRQRSRFYYQFARRQFQITGTAQTVQPDGQTNRFWAAAATAVRHGKRVRLSHVHRGHAGRASFLIFMFCRDFAHLLLRMVEKPDVDCQATIVIFHFPALFYRLHQEL